MSHRTFKVCILIDDQVENYYLKHYIDEIQPCFYRFKNQVFQRNPMINVPNLKIYWIDSEEDDINITTEEDFRVFLEEGKGRKIFFSSNNNQQKRHEDDKGEFLMDAEESGHKCERKSRKLYKDDEKKKRHAEKLVKKLKHYEESYKAEEERSRRNSSKHGCGERVERARRRLEQFRSLVGSSVDPANLNASNDQNENAQPTTSTDLDLLNVISPETVRLLSNAIAGCLQPCTVINKVLNDVFALIPQVIEPPNNSGNVSSGSNSVGTVNIDQQQQTIEIPRQNTATNTSDANTPIAVRQGSLEIEALFKEAAKELEKMNEIVNNKMETSTTSSSNTGITQIENNLKDFPNITDSAMSDMTIIDANQKSIQANQDMIDAPGSSIPVINEEFKIATPPKSIRSRESSIEVHDANSMMSDDSRDWTFVVSQDIDQDDFSIEQTSRIVDAKTGAIPKDTKADGTSQVNVEVQTPEINQDSVKSMSTETQTQTPTSLLSEQQQQQLQLSVQKSIDIVQKSIETIKKTMENSNTQKPETVTSEVPSQQQEQQQPNSLSSEGAAAIVNPSSYGFRDNLYPNISQANLNATASAPPNPVFMMADLEAKMRAKREELQGKISQQPIPTPQIKQKFEPAVVVYDPNPKINAAVHTMLAMGFSNDDNWLTQLLINVDGDIPKAINFLQPKPKNPK